MNLKISYLVLGLGIIPTFGNIANAEDTQQNSQIPGYAKDASAYNEIITICQRLVAGNYEAQSAPCPDLKCDDVSTATKFKNLIETMKTCYKPDASFKEDDIVGKIREFCGSNTKCTTSGGLIPGKEKTYTCYNENGGTKTSYTFSYKDKMLTSIGVACSGCPDGGCSWSFHKISEKDVISTLVTQVGGKKKNYSCSLTNEYSEASSYSCTYNNNTATVVIERKSKKIADADSLRNTFGIEIEGFGNIN